MIRILGAIVANELRLLFRDRAGLLLLFLMPAVLVAVISLVQENIMKTTGESGVRMLFIDRDGGEVGKLLRERLQESEHVRLVSGQGDTSDESAKRLLANDEFQLCLIVPEGFGEKMENRVARLVENAFGGETRAFSEMESSPPPELVLWFDPLVQGSFRVSVVNALHAMMLSLEMEAKARAFSRAVPGYVRSILRDFARFEPPEGSLPPVGDDWGGETVLALRTDLAGRGDFDKLPTSVQQNVPAWSLFGMFFIVVPLSGSLIRERREGILKRLMTLPVSYGLLLLGKALAYVLICLIQFVLILLLGKYVLPLLGTAVLETGPEWEAIVCVVLSAGLAAAGYGIMVGNLSRTYEQASMLGALSVVIAAALGGVMVPAYAMPQVMQDISRFSPLAWGLNALTGIFVRGECMGDVWFETSLLLGFACFAILVGWRSFVQRWKKA